MSEEDWDQFFELVDKINSLPGSWQDRRDTVLAQAEQYDADFEEFASWFADADAEVE